jgi:drug/metabolite transporter (DMT)-like permease
MTNLASLLKHRGCRHADPVCIRSPLRSARGLAASHWFMAGWGLAAVAWLVHVAALSMAPISIVQAVLAGGAVTLAVMAQRLFGDPVERRQWLALLLGGAGLVLLVLTVPHFKGSHSGFSIAAILGFEGGLALLAAGLLSGHRSDRLAEHGNVLLAAIAGTLFALAGVAIKGLTGAGDVSVTVLAPWILLTLAAGVLAQYAAVAALQRGGAIETIGLMGLVANAAQIVGGVLVFGDPLSTNPFGLTLQAIAFAMVCTSALLIPTQRAGAKPSAAVPA